MAFSIRADIIPALQQDFGFTATQMGQIAGPGLWGFTITIVLGGLLVDLLGMRKILFLAFWGHISGVFLTIFATGYWSLFLGTLLIGLANGTVEAVINPLAATLYPKKKTKYLNMLHAWWPGGLIIGGLLGYSLTKGMGLDAVGASQALISLGWKIKMSLILVPTIIYGFLIFGQKFPETERVASGVSTADMFKECVRPLFVFFILLMMCTSAAELGPDQWVGKLLENLIGIQGVLLLIYTAGIMFILRQFFAGMAVKKLTPLGVLAFASALTSLGLYLLSTMSSDSSIILVFVAATIFGIGKTYFWPTMLGFVAERFPRGGALVLGLMGGAGMLAVGWLMTPAMGKIQDYYAVQSLSAHTQEVVVSDGGLDERKVANNTDESIKEEIAIAKQYSAVMTYRWVAGLPFILMFIFAGLYLYFKRRGGYEVVAITNRS